MYVDDNYVTACQHMIESYGKYSLIVYYDIKIISHDH